MPESSSRFSWVPTMARIAMILVLIALGLAIVATGAAAIRSFMAREIDSLVWLAGALVGEIAGIFLLVTWFGVISIFHGTQAGLDAVNDRLKRTETLLDALNDSSRRQTDLAQLSDAAKSLIFRQREIEAMNELLHEMLIRQNYDGAAALVNDIARGLGFTEQIEQMRGEIAKARESTIDQRIDSAMERINKLLGDEDYAEAMRQAQRLLQLLPDNARIANLPQHIRNARTKHKRDLLQAYGEAVRAGDIDKSIDLLRQLDKYLTPQEGAALEESARGVFRTKLHNLGVQFAIRVTDQQWSEAIAIGEQIVGEFPNSRMAQEVRVKMDSLRTLAEQKTPKPQP